jgi:hypothetical protein
MVKTRAQRVAEKMEENKADQEDNSGMAEEVEEIPLEEDRDFTFSLYDYSEDIDDHQVVFHGLVSTMETEIGEAMMDSLYKDVMDVIEADNTDIPVCHLLEPEDDSVDLETLMDMMEEEDIENDITEGKEPGLGDFEIDQSLISTEDEADRDSLPDLEEVESDAGSDDSGIYSDISDQDIFRYEDAPWSRSLDLDSEDYIRTTEACFDLGQGCFLQSSEGTLTFIDTDNGNTLTLEKNNIIEFLSNIGLMKDAMEEEYMNYFNFGNGKMAQYEGGVMQMFHLFKKCQAVCFPQRAMFDAITLITQWLTSVWPDLLKELPCSMSHFDGIQSNIRECKACRPVMFYLDGVCSTENEDDILL